MLNIKTKLLTASRKFPPFLDRNARSLAHFSIILQSFAKEMTIACCHAYIVFTVVQIHLRVDGAVTFMEWSVCLCDDSTECITLPMLHVFVCAAPTSTHTVISALSILAYPLNLPTASKGHGRVSLGARRCSKIIVGVAIEVATEPTSLTGIRLGQTDKKTTVPVVSDNQAKISLNNNRLATLRQYQLIVV